MSSHYWTKIVFFFIFVTSKVTVSLLKFEICCNLFPYSTYIFTYVHTFVSLSLDSLREHTELSVKFHETWTEACREEVAPGQRAHPGSWPGGRQAGSLPQRSIRMERKHSPPKSFCFAPPYPLNLSISPEKTRGMETRKEIRGSSVGAFTSLWSVSPALLVAGQLAGCLRHGHKDAQIKSTSGHSTRQLKIWSV